MSERRRHPRIRFIDQPPILIGTYGASGEGWIENISGSGLLLRTGLNLPVGGAVGCEFVLEEWPIDLSASVLSRKNDHYCLRFRYGPLSRTTIDLAIDAALLGGRASTLVLVERHGRRVLSLVGALGHGSAQDLLETVQRTQADELDFSEISSVDPAALPVCAMATHQPGVRLGDVSECFQKAWSAFLGGLKTPTTPG